MELSDREIENNAKNPDRLDLNTCIGTLIYMHREQHFSSLDVVGSRIKAGMLLKLVNKLLSEQKVHL